MGGDIFHRRPSYISACVTPSCAPVNEEYSRIQTTQHKCPNLNRRLRKILGKIIGIYENRKPITFQYDPVSYSKNFDDGFRRDDE